MPRPAKASMEVPSRQVRAAYDSETIIVYQAYKASIADPAVAEQRLHASPLFKHTRMTWIKPSWAWMLYRSGYSLKDAGQERILALHMKHEHFIELLEYGALAHKKLGFSSNALPGDSSKSSASLKSSGKDDEADNGDTSSPGNVEAHTRPYVRVQWDPERTVRLEKLLHRSIQIGIPGALSPKWTETMIVKIEDVTQKARELKRLLDEQEDITEEELIRRGLVPAEKVFEVPEHVQTLLEMGLETTTS